MRNHRLRRNQSCFWQPISGPLAHQHTKRARTKCNIMIINFCIYRPMTYIRKFGKYVKIYFESDFGSNTLRLCSKLVCHKVTWLDGHDIFICQLFILFIKHESHYKAILKWITFALLESLFKKILYICFWKGKLFVSQIWLL